MVHYGALNKDIELLASVFDRNASHIEQSRLRPELASQVVRSDEVELLHWNDDLVKVERCPEREVTREMDSFTVCFEPDISHDLQLTK